VKPFARGAKTLGPGRVLAYHRILAPRERVLMALGAAVLDLLLIAAIVLLVFGAKKLRTVGSDLGAAVKGFRKAMTEPSAEQPREQLGSGRPDAEFPEVTAARERNEH
jgi:sec-independent protein translocase protein TatA